MHKINVCVAAMLRRNVPDRLVGMARASSHPNLQLR
jgi:hypothetical protein